MLFVIAAATSVPAGPPTESPTFIENWGWNAGGNLGATRQSADSDESTTMVTSVSANLWRSFDSGVQIGVNGDSSWGVLVADERLWLNSISALVESGSEASRYSLIPRYTHQSLGGITLSFQTDLSFEYTYGKPERYLMMSLTLGSIQVTDARYQELSGPIRAFRMYGESSLNPNFGVGAGLTIGKSGISPSAYELELAAHYNAWESLGVSLSGTIGQTLQISDGFSQAVHAQLSYGITHKITASLSQLYIRNSINDPLQAVNESQSFARLSFTLGGVQ